MAGRTGSGETAAGTRWARSAVGNGAAALSVCAMAMGPSILKSIDMPELSFLLWRLLFAVPFYGLLLLVARQRVGWTDLRRSARGGLAFGVHMLLLVVAFRRTSATNAVLIISLQPVVMLVAGARLFGERPHRSVYGWGLAAFVGVVLTVLASEGGGVATREGDLLAVLLMLSFVAFMVVSKQARGQVDSSPYQLAVTLMAAAMVLPVVLLVEGGVVLPTGSDWGLVVAMAFLGGSGYLLLTVANGYTSLTMVSLISLGYMGVVPLFAWWLVGEAVGGAQVVGIVVVLVALCIVVTRSVEVVSPPAAQDSVAGDPTPDVPAAG
ncbi:MAG: hypothetical protein CMJ69_13700 [Planctomycetaceae bacterium]|nr:hypothetical protein [Planctomycetaceae bacterium]